MVFTDDTNLSLQAAVFLANSGLEPDTLTSVEALDAYFRDYQYTGRHDRTLEELEAVRSIRDTLHDLFVSDEDELVQKVNQLMREYDALPQLVRHDDLGWHFHACDSDRPLQDRIIVETVMALSDMIRADETSRLSVCADDDCEGVVLDLSRNRSKRYCSLACGNRNAVAAYRARQTASS